MLCDRCVANAKCKRFKPEGECVLEKKAFEKIVLELMEQYELEGVADRILAERAAMYLIRIARAEAYESAVGVTEKSSLWGAYISRLDNTLRGLLSDLAVTRTKRKQFEKNEALLVNVDDLLKKFARSERESRMLKKVIIKKLWVKKRLTVYAPKRALLTSWRRECRQFRGNIRRRGDVGNQEEKAAEDS
jgi:hypothetical protein